MEIASLTMMSALVPAGYVPDYNLLWRASTLYLPALARFVCLATALLQDTRRVVRPTWRRPPCAAPMLCADGAASVEEPS